MTWTSAARFYRQLSLVHKAGISLAQAVGMAGGATNGEHRLRAQAWSQACTQGSQFADQLEASKEEPFAIALIRAGERSGRIPEMATLVAEHYEHRLALRDLILARLIYPVILLHVALVMPAVVLVLAYSWPVASLLIGPACIWAVAFGVYLAEKTSRRTGLTARMVLQQPLSYLAMPMVIANSCHVLRAGLTAGMLVPDALELAADGCGNREMAARLRAAGEGVRHGRIPNLAAAIGACGFPSTELGLISNAETVGKLEEVLGQVATLAEESFRLRTLWAAKIFTGVIYGIAMLAAIIVIFSMVNAFYLGPIKDTLKEMDGG
jgi:type II secretory pathway component PulF